jgi:hypothetical protein
MVLRLDCEPLAIELGLLLIGVNVMTIVLCQVIQLLRVLIHQIVPLAQF